MSIVTKSPHFWPDIVIVKDQYRLTLTLSEYIWSPELYCAVRQQCDTGVSQPTKEIVHKVGRFVEKIFQNAPLFSKDVDLQFSQNGEFQVGVNLEKPPVLPGWFRIERVAPTIL